MLIEKQEYILKLKNYITIYKKGFYLIVKDFSNLFFNCCLCVYYYFFHCWLLFFLSIHAQLPGIPQYLRMINHLKFLSEYDVPYNKDFQNTIIGGLSGIDYDPRKNVYYIISDDRSEKNPARFYKAEIIINQDKIDSVIFLDTKFFKNSAGNFYPDSHNDPYHTPDPEAITL